MQKEVALHGAPVRVLIINNRMLGESLRAVFDGEADIAVIGIATSAQDADQWVRAEAPDVVVIDMDVVGLDGLEAIRRIRALDRTIRLLVMADSDRAEAALRALELGAVGLITKQEPADRMVDCVRQAAAGASCLPSTALKDVVMRLDEHRVARGVPPGTPPLTYRELEILQAIAQGESTGAIARRLGIARETVRSHVRNLLPKLHAHSRLEAVAAVRRSGLATALPPTPPNGRGTKVL